MTQVWCSCINSNLCIFMFFSISWLLLSFVGYNYFLVKTFLKIIFREDCDYQWSRTQTGICSWLDSNCRKWIYWSWIQWCIYSTWKWGSTSLWILILFLSLFITFCSWEIFTNNQSYHLTSEICRCSVKSHCSLYFLLLQEVNKYLIFILFPFFLKKIMIPNLFLKRLAN